MKPIKVGSMIKIRKDLKYGTSYDDIIVRYPHQKLAGKTVKVIEVLQNKYFKTEGSGEFYFNREMIEDVVNKPAADIENYHGAPVTMTIYVDRAIYNDPATVLFYTATQNGVVRKGKVVAKCQNGDVYDKEDGLNVCVLKAFTKECKRMLKMY